MSAAFDAALKVVLRHEGGFVNDANDHGGPTNMGITVDDWTIFYGAPATLENIRALTPVMAGQIYQKLFWNRMNLDSLTSSALATVLLDQGVVRGIAGAVCLVQSLIGVAQDGQMGPNTLAALNRANGRQLAFRFVRASVHHYTAICSKDPSQVKFLGGWSDRLFGLLDCIFFGDNT